MGLYHHMHKSNGCMLGISVHCKITKTLPSTFLHRHVSVVMCTLQWWVDRCQYFKSYRIGLSISVDLPPNQWVGVFILQFTNHLGNVLVLSHFYIAFNCSPTNERLPKTNDLPMINTEPTYYLSVFEVPTSVFPYVVLSVWFVGIPTQDPSLVHLYTFNVQADFPNWGHMSLWRNESCKSVLRYYIISAIATSSLAQCVFFLKQ